MATAPKNITSTFAPPLTSDPTERETLTLVRDALAQGRVMLAYQPVVNAHSAMRRPAFYEGLLRVKNPEGRIIPAGKFMPVVETLELGRVLDCVALSLGLEALRTTPDLRLAINMSARSIGYRHWGETLQKGLAKNPTIAERLVLEVTETSAMCMPEVVAAFMTDLQREGISFALDDFGAGFTSFRYLKDFKFDIIKIDGSFVRGVDQDANNQCLIHSLLTIAKQFEMFSVAELVETRQEAEFLVRAGIDCLQGYYYGKPEVAPKWLEEHTNLDIEAIS